MLPLGTLLVYEQKATIKRLDKEKKETVQALVKAQETTNQQAQTAEWIERQMQELSDELCCQKDVNEELQKEKEMVHSTMQSQVVLL